MQQYQSCVILWGSANRASRFCSVVTSTDRLEEEQEEEQEEQERARVAPPLVLLTHNELSTLRRLASDPGHAGA